MANHAAVLRYLADLVHGTVAADSQGGPATCVRMGSEDVHLAVLEDSPPVLQVSCVLLRGVPASPALLAALNTISSRSSFVRVFHDADSVHAVGDLLLEVLSDVAVTNMVTAVAEVADYYDDELQQRFGGLRSSDDPRGCRACALSYEMSELRAAIPSQPQAAAEAIA